VNESSALVKCITVRAGAVLLRISSGHSPNEHNISIVGIGASDGSDTSEREEVVNRMAKSATRNRIKDILPTNDMFISDTDQPAYTERTKTKTRIVLYCQSNETDVERNRRILLQLSTE
jgi:hypothetical protein